MPESKLINVEDLALDLRNFRTVPQKSESKAIDAMISTSPDRFWALVESLQSDGYLPTENIIVLKRTGSPTTSVVKEGNRRVAALKLLHGIIPIKKLSAEIPSNVRLQIASATATWRAENSSVPCAVYKASEAATVDKIVTLAHGKGEKAGRDQWNAVARARHNRDENGASETGLDLLEKYIRHGKNMTTLQRARWAGDYYLSVLDEALKKLAPRLGYASATELTKAYPADKHASLLEKVLFDVGLKELGFDDIRDKQVDFAKRYGIASEPPKGSAESAKEGTEMPNALGTVVASTAAKASAGGASKSAPSGAAKVTGTGAAQPVVKPNALPINDPRAVQRHLKAFVPKGSNREKVVTLKIEGSRLDVGKTPLAFAFVLRSLFEISAKAYCADHSGAGGPTLKKADGSDRSLADVLRDITNHLTRNKKDKEMVKTLHGAMAELAKQDGFLSVTSLNQLVHNPKFSVAPGDVAILFGNVLPLLQSMNE